MKIVLFSVLPFILGYDLCNARLSRPSNETGDYNIQTLTDIPNPLHPNNRSQDFELRCFRVEIANESKMCLRKKRNNNTRASKITDFEGFFVFLIISALFVNIALFYINTQRMKIIQKQIQTLKDMAQANDIPEAGNLQEIVSTSRQNSKSLDDLKTIS